MARMSVMVVEVESWVARCLSEDDHEVEVVWSDTFDRCYAAPRKRERLARSVFWNSWLERTYLLTECKAVLLC